MSDEKGLLGIIGMCRKAGKAIIGTPMVCEYLKKAGINKNTSEDPCIIIEASDTSENTHKRICDKASYYNVKHVRIQSTCDVLGKAVGKGEVAAIAIADPNFCRAVLGKIARNNGDT